MKTGVFTVVLGSMKLEQALDYVAALGVQAVELGAGGYAGTTHCPVDELLASERKARAFLQAINSRGLIISALTCAGNPIHPNKKLAAARQKPELGDLPLAAGLFGDARLPVE